MNQSQLESAPLGPLICKFAVPAIASALVGAMYNIVDQIFIGWSVGILGNAATNVAFPLTTICTAAALLIGIGSASNFSLEMGRKNPARAANVVGNGVALMLLSGVVIGILARLFLQPMLGVFGATAEVMPYALTYTGITAFGFPLLILTTGGSHLIRADGSPKYAMACTVSGAVLNAILDPILIFGLHLDMAGAAIATVIGQGVSAIMVIAYFRRFKTVPLVRQHFRPRAALGKAIASLGMAACFNQLAMMVVQIAMNNTLTYYGGASQYGSAIPLACVGVITKVNIVCMAFILGISQGCQPIFGYNYGAGNYARVKETYKKAALAATALSTVAFLCFQLFPRQIVGIFGQGSEAYFHFAERYLRIYMMITFLNGLQPLTANFFTSIGKAKKGILMSLTRQTLLLLPLILILPLFMGIDGVVYAGPIADIMAAFLAIVLVRREMGKMDERIAQGQGISQSHGGF